jgi:hypothetical protein
MRMRQYNQAETGPKIRGQRKRNLVHRVSPGRRLGFRFLLTRDLCWPVRLCDGGLFEPPDRELGHLSEHLGAV